MAPRDQTKAAPKVQRAIVKINTTNRTSAGSSNSTIKKTTTTRKVTEKTPEKGNTSADTRQTTNRVRKVATPKPKENKVATVPGSVTKSGKKLWKRRPMPAHSGVPVPEKMKRLKFLKEADDCIF